MLAVAAITAEWLPEVPSTQASFGVFLDDRKPSDKRLSIDVVLSHRFGAL